MFPFVLHLTIPSGCGEFRFYYRSGVCAAKPLGAAHWGLWHENLGPPFPLAKLWFLGSRVAVAEERQGAGVAQVKPTAYQG